VGGQAGQMRAPFRRCNVLPLSAEAARSLEETQFESQERNVGHIEIKYLKHEHLR
jgi:hypothetical protein